MTGHPEAVLAREMRQCYSAIALVTDMDAGVEAGHGVGQEEVFALFRQNLERLKELLTRTIATAARPRRVQLLDLGRRARADVRRPGSGRVRVLLTGSAGFIGTAIGDALEAARRRGRPGRPDAGAGTRRDRAARPGTHRLDVRRRRQLDRTCSTASTPCATRPPSSAPGYGRGPARLRRPQRLGTAVLLAAMHEAGVDRLVLASSMVVYGEGRYACAEHGHQAPPAARASRRWTRGDFENHCPVLRRRPRLGAGRRGRPARPAQLVRRQQGGAGALHVGVGAAGGGRGRGACATTTSTGPGCPGTRRTPGSRRCSAPASSAARLRGSSRTAARCATSCTSATSRRPTSRRYGR